jgi:hypothetical protein
VSQDDEVQMGEPSLSATEPEDDLGDAAKGKGDADFTETSPNI